MTAQTWWRGDQPLVLASKSTARLALLVAAGLPVEAFAAAVDERAVEEAMPGAAPEAVALALARAKALAGARETPGRLVVGADQTLAVAGETLHKAANQAQARIQLRRLAGKTHALHSAVAVALDGEVLFETVSSARLAMRELSEDALDAYLSAAGPRVLTSVGCYQLESLGVHLFTHIEGDHFTILGLPLLPLLAFFRERELLP